MRRVEIAEGKFLDIKREEKVRFEDFVLEYLEYAKVNKRSWKRDARSLKLLGRSFNGKLLHEINPQMIEKYKAERLNQVKGSTVNRELACLKHLFNLAIRWGRAHTNPMKEIRLFRESPARIRYLTKPEITKLLSTSSDFLKPILITALHTGMRMGEILRLKWEDIDFERGIIEVTETKSGEPRKIPMNNLLTETLRSIKLPCVSPYVFCRTDGRPRKSIRTAFENALKRAGIENFRFHDLRHTFASHLVMAGADLPTVKELLGHKTIEMTMRYAHLSPDHKRVWVEALVQRMDTKGKIEKSEVA